jgi:hypothetical protein
MEESGAAPAGFLERLGCRHRLVMFVARALEQAPVDFIA